MSDAAHQRDEAPRGTALLPEDLTEEQLAAAPVLTPTETLSRLPSIREVVIDTGIFSASVSRRRRPRYHDQLQLPPGNQVFLAAATVAESSGTDRWLPGGVPAGGRASKRPSRRPRSFRSRTTC